MAKIFVVALVSILLIHYCYAIPISLEELYSEREVGSSLYNNMIYKCDNNKKKFEPIVKDFDHFLKNACSNSIISNIIWYIYMCNDRI